MPGARPITVLAATGRVGAALVHRLVEDGHPVIAVGRSADKLCALGTGIATRVANLDDPVALRRALEDARVVVSTAHAAFAPAVLGALPRGQVERLVQMGSTRYFSRYPDSTKDLVAAAVAALAAAEVPGVVLLATLIYGPAGGSVVHRIADYLRRLPVVPLPDGGRSTIQPIHVDDVARALAAAATRETVAGGPIIIAGPAPLAYAEMVRAIGRAIGRRAVILPLPAGLVPLAAGMLHRFPRGAAVAGALHRLTEDKAFDIGAMRDRLGVEPMGFEAGLATLFPSTSP